MAFAALTLFGYFYYNVPVHFADQDGATDFVWEHNTVYNRLTEGFGYGRTNNEGYMNLFDYQEGMDIDVLIMGSSHLEAQFIPEKNNVSYLLNERLIDKNIYNISISGHSFKVCLNNLESALRKYSPSYVVIETGNLVFSDEYIKSIMTGNVEEKGSYSEGLLGLLQQNPFLRLMYTQIESIANKYEDIEADESNTTVSDVEINKTLTGDLLKFIKMTADNYETKVIILYHPDVAIGQDGKMVIETKDISSEFDELCQKNGIHFVDMTERFLSEYENGYILPKGFCNTAVASGHLNSEGHRMIADELYKEIMGMD